MLPICSGPTLLKQGLGPAWPPLVRPSGALGWFCGPSTVHTATAFQTVWRHRRSLLRTIPQTWGTILSVWTFHKYQRDSELGRNMKAGEMIFTNEPLMPREVKWFRQREDKDTRCDNYSSVTALIALACAYNSLRISSKTRWVPGGASVLYMLAPRRGRCRTGRTALWEARICDEEGAPSISLGREYILEVLGRTETRSSVLCPPKHIPGQKVPCMSEQLSTRLRSCIFWEHHDYMNSQTNNIILE